MNGRAWLGLGCIVATIATVGVLLSGVEGIGTLSARLGDHATGRLRNVRVAFESRPRLDPGDPVYSVESEAFALQGRVLRVSEAAPWIVDIEVDPSVTRRFGPGTRIIAMAPDGDLAWVLRTLVPPNLRKDLIADLGDLWKLKRTDTLEALKPHIVALAGDLGSILGEAFPNALQRNEVERRAFFAAFRTRVLDPKLKPVLEREFVARLEERLGPLAGEMGAEIWKAVSIGDLMSLTWVATKDVFGAAKNREMAIRLSKLLKQKALPVFKEHVPTAFRHSMEALIEGLNEPHVQQALDQALKDTLVLPEFQEFVAAVVDSWLVHNPDLHQRLIAAFESDELRRPLEDLWKAAEPKLEEALTEILTRKDREGMDHQLVRVLRRVVLKKDESYLVIDGDRTGPFDSASVLTGVLGEDR